MTARLSPPALRLLSNDVALPRYDRAMVAPGIVHLGVGAFHRVHQASFVDACLAAGQNGWGIIGASLRSTETRDALAPQDGLYTLAIRNGDSETLRIVGSILTLLVAPEDPAALLAAMTDPRIRIVTLTVTEKGYLRNTSGDLDIQHPDIVADLANPARPRTVHGFIVEALARRRSAGTSPFTLLSCDNLPSNGKTLRKLLMQFAELRDPQLARHIADEVACPSSMVDQIVPATTSADRTRISKAIGAEDAWPVVTEPFCQWVIEDDFPVGRPDWEKFGVTMVADVTPFEVMKLRLLNGAHSAVAYLGQLYGFETVAEAFAEPIIREFVEGVWAELKPTLPANAGFDPDAYTEQLSVRFSNTALKHRTAQIANDGSQKLPQRIVAAALERLDAKEGADHLAFVIAAWIAAMSGRPAPRTFTDPLDERLANLDLSDDPRTAVDGIFSMTGFAKDAAQKQQLADLVATQLIKLRSLGVRAALVLSSKKDLTAA